MNWGINKKMSRDAKWPLSLPGEYHISAGRQHRPSFGEDSGGDIDQDAATDAKEKTLS